MKSRAVTGVTIVVMFAALVATTATDAAPRSHFNFKAGLYVGKTSQGYAVKLRLTVAGGRCSGGPCLSSPNDNTLISMALPCPTIGTTANATLFLLDRPVARNGTVNADDESFSKTVATIKVGHHGTLTGRLRATETLQDGARCDSGPVTLSARLKG